MKGKITVTGAFGNITRTYEIALVGGHPTITFEGFALQTLQAELDDAIKDPSTFLGTCNPKPNTMLAVLAVIHNGFFSTVDSLEVVGVTLPDFDPNVVY